MDTLTLLLNTPMVPPEENPEQKEIPLTELPVSSRNSVGSNILSPNLTVAETVFQRQYTSRSNFDEGTSSGASSADSLRTSFDIVPLNLEFEVRSISFSQFHTLLIRTIIQEVQLSHPSSFQKSLTRTPSARAVPVSVPRSARIYSVDDTTLNDTFGLAGSEQVDWPRSLGEITFAPVHDQEDPLF